MKNLIIALLLLFSVSVNAQTPVLVSCSDYNKESGEPSGVYDGWYIKPDGASIHIIYAQAQIITKQLLLYVDRQLSDGGYIMYDTKYFKNSTTSRRNWAVFDYFFTEAGKYKITAVEEGKKLATSFVTIRIAANE